MTTSIRQQWRSSGVTSTFTVRRSKVVANVLLCLGLLANVAIAQTSSRVIGYVDGFNSAGALVGWACSTGRNDSISVHLYVGGPAGSGTAIGAYRANQPSEAAVASSCGASGANYRYSIPLSTEIRQLHAGKAVFVHGISPVGAVNPTLTHSGNFVVTAPSPSPLAAPLYTRTETITYHDNTAKWVLGQVASRTINGVVAEQTSYDPNTAMPLQVRSFGKLKQTLTYNADGTIATVKDGNNNVTTLASWKRGIPQSITYADGKTQAAVVNDNGWITQVTDENGYTTNYTYDAMGRLASTIYPTGDSTAWNTTTQAFVQVNATEYGIPAGHWRQTVTTGNGVKVSYFDALWRPLLVREYDAGNAAGTQRFTGYEYDHEGRVVFASYPSAASNPDKGVWTTYDALGRVRAVAQDSELGLLTTITGYLSDANGAYTLVTKPGGQQTRTWYQMFDKPSYDAPVKITHPEGAVTTIIRDVFGKPTSIVRGNSSGTVKATRTYAYNANHELCRTVEPETGATLMGYDAAGNPSWSAAGLPAATACHATGAITAIQPRRVARTYDARNRLKTLVFPDGRGNQTWTYTADGLPSSVVANNGDGNVVTTEYTYNRRRLLAGERMLWNQIIWPIGYSYNANGHLSGESYPGELSVAFEPNALGQPTRAGSFASGVSYYPNGGIKQFTYGNGIVHTMAQNARQLPNRSTDCVVAGCTAAADKRLDLSYGFDKNGNVSQITDNIAGRQSRSMSYDGLERLTRTTSAMFGTATYAYDVLDNLTQVNVAGGSAARNHYYCYDAKWQLTNVKTGGCNGASVIGLGYDVQGNLINKNGRVFNFDFGNRLRGVNGVASYVYDAAGRRVRDYTTASKYSLYAQDGRLMYTNDARLGVSTQYVYLGGSLVAFREKVGETITPKYQHTDALGSPIAVTGANKALLESSEYEPYGQVVNRVAKDGPGFTGHVLDAATGMNYMQQRYYDPQIGRFLSVDPIAVSTSEGAGFNRYSYAANNPYKFIDPDGRCEKITGSNICARSLTGTAARFMLPTQGKTDMAKVQRSWPVPGHTKLNAADKPGEGRGEFGSPRNTSRGRSTHTGIDIEAPKGARVVAAQDGAVIKIRPNPSATYGNQVVIDHGDGSFSQYAHLDTVLVKAGVLVNGGQDIGAVGRTGNTPSLGDSHLHFEIRMNGPAPRAAGGIVVDPIPNLPEP